MAKPYSGSGQRRSGRNLLVAEAVLRRLLVLAAVMAALLTGSQAFAQSASDLLEKGIYTEETVGDLEGAIKIYAKVVSEAKTTRGYAAQAQYRLAMCYLKMGKKEEATAALKKVVEEFSDQKEIVAKAKEQLPGAGGLELQAVPWQDGEQLQLTAKLGTGLPIGTFILSTRSDQIDGREVWRMLDAQSGPVRRLSNYAFRVYRETKGIPYRMLHHLYGRMNFSIPFFVSNYCGRDANRRAGRVYRAQPYSGRITFFHALKNKNNALTGWPELAHGGLDVIELNEHHGELFQGDIRKLSTAFKSHLERAQQRAQGAASRKVVAESSSGRHAASTTSRHHNSPAA